MALHGLIQGPDPATPKYLGCLLLNSKAAVPDTKALITKEMLGSKYLRKKIFRKVTYYTNQICIHPQYHSTCLMSPHL